MQKLAKIETAKVPANAIAGVKANSESNVIRLDVDDAPYRRIGIVILVLVFGVFALWSAIAPLGTYVMATGQVTAQMKKQVIQHREGGVIEEIFVEDGDVVKKGQKLLEISPTEAEAEQGIIQEQLWSNLALEARFDAEVEGHSKIVFPNELVNSKLGRVVEIMAGESQQFKVRKEAADAEAAVMRQRIQQLQEEIQGTKKQVKAQQALADSYLKEVGTLRGLFERQLISKLQLDEADRRYLSVNSGIAELEANIASLQVRIGETEEQLVLQASNRTKDASANLAEVRMRLADLNNRLQSTSDRLSRTVVVAPEAGTVVGLVYHTKGGVVQPGGTILEIVPKASGFEIDAQVAISDIDKVHAGLAADIRFPAFSSASFLQVTPGEVVQVSADAFTNEANGASFYRARVKILPEGVANLEKKHLELIQGMPAEVSITTGNRTFLDYLLKPLTNMVNHAFNEE